MQSEWAMFSASIVDAATYSYGYNVCHGGNPRIRSWTWAAMDDVKLKKESYRPWGSGATWSENYHLSFLMVKIQKVQG